MVGMIHNLDLVYIESESRSAVSDSLQPHGPYSPWNSPGQNTGVGSLSFLQGISPTQGWNPGLLCCRWIPYQLSHKGSPAVREVRGETLNVTAPLMPRQEAPEG